MVCGDGQREDVLPGLNGHVGPPVPSGYPSPSAAGLGEHSQGISILTAKHLSALTMCTLQRRCPFCRSPRVPVWTWRKAMAMAGGSCRSFPICLQGGRLSGLLRRCLPVLEQGPTFRPFRRRLQCPQEPAGLRVSGLAMGGRSPFPGREIGSLRPSERTCSRLDRQ